MGDQDDLCAVGLGGAQGLHQVAGSAGVGDEQHHVLLGHQAGRHDLHVTVGGGTELVGDAGEPGADLVGGDHAAALSHAEHLPGAVQQRHSLLHRLRRKSVLGAVDGGHEQRRGVFAQSSGVGVRGGLLLVHQHTGGVGLRQRNTHFVVALKAQRPAEPEHRGLGHLTLSGQR